MLFLVSCDLPVCFLYSTCGGFCYRCPIRWQKDWWWWFFFFLFCFCDNDVQMCMIGTLLLSHSSHNSLIFGRDFYGSGRSHDVTLTLHFQNPKCASFFSSSIFAVMVAACFFFVFNDHHWEFTGRKTGLGGAGLTLLQGWSTDTAHEERGSSVCCLFWRSGAWCFMGHVFFCFSVSWVFLWACKWLL